MFKNFGVYVIGKGVNGLIKFLITPLLSILFTQADFGKVGLITVIYPVISILLGLGTTASFSLKFYKISYEQRINLRKTIVLFSIVLFCMSLLLLLLFSNTIEANLELGISLLSYMKIFAIGYFIFLVEFILELYKMNQEPIKYNLLQTVNSVTLFAITLGFTYFVDNSIEWYINGFFCSYLFFLLFIIVYERVTNNTIKIPFVIDYKLYRECIKLGFPIIIGFLFSLGLNSADRYILKDIMNSFSVIGIYTFGYKMGEVFNSFILTAFLVASSPLLFKSFSDDIKDFEVKINTLLKYLIGISIIYLIFLNVGVDLVFEYMFQDYVEAKPIIEIVTISFIIFGIGQLISSIIVVNEKLQVTTFFSVFAAALNIFLNYLFIPKYGILGAANSSLVSYFLLTICTYFYSKKLMSKKLMKIDLNFRAHFKIIISACILVFIIKAVNLDNAILEFSIRLIIALFYMVALYKLKFFIEFNRMISRRFSKS